MKSLGKRVFSAALACVLLVSATVSLNASAASASNMTDIPSGSWYESAVQYCLNNNYMNGESETKFNPNGTVSRAQMVQVLYNLEGQPNLAGEPNVFNDVDITNWYFRAVTWAKAKNIASGTSATTFNPNAPVTREQVATFFANYAKFKNNYSGAQNDLSKYSDRNKISSWAKENISWAVNYGLMSGTSETTLDPQGTCIRAQLAQFIKNYFKDDSGTEITPTPTPTPEPEDPDTKPVNGLAPEQKSTGGLVSEGKIEKTADDTIITFPVYNYGAGMQAYFDRDSVDLLPVPADGVVNEGENGHYAFPDEPNNVCPYYTDLGIIPAGGYVENGRIYTAQGFDVTSVDGVATAAEMAVLEDVNEYRRNAGIPELEWNEMMQIYADERAIELANQFDIYDSFVKPGLKNGQIPSALENKLGSGMWGHDIWNGGNPVSANEMLNYDDVAFFKDYWLGMTTNWFEDNYAGLFKHTTDEHPLNYYTGSGLVNENATFGAPMNADTNAADRWYTSLKGHKEIMMDRSKTCAAVGIARVDGVGSCVVLLVS